MITDEMIHGSWAGLREATRKSRSNLCRRTVASAQPEPIAPQRPRNHKQPPRGIRIDWDTPIIPQIIAQAVCEEAAGWLASPLPSEWIHKLAERANTVYARNDRFRRTIQNSGNRGRDFLWVFTRHWLAALLKEHRPHLFVRLPSSYCTGRDLPETNGARHSGPQRLPCSNTR